MGVWTLESRVYNWQVHAGEEKRQRVRNLQRASVDLKVALRVERLPPHLLRADLTRSLTIVAKFWCSTDVRFSWSWGWRVY